MKVEIIVLQLIRVGVPILGPQFLNFRRFWRKPRMVQYTSMQVVLGLLGLFPFFGV